MNNKAIIAISSALVLAGCTPDTVFDDPKGPQIYQPEVKRFGAVPENITVEYDAVVDEIRIANQNDGLQLQEATKYEVDGFTLYRNDQSMNASYGTTSSGAGYTGAAVSPLTAGLGIIAGGEFGRLTETTLPQSGAATFSGNYTSFIANAETGASRFLVIGTAELTADLDQSQISGVISDRADRIFPDDTLEDLILEATAINDAGFTGTASGGEFTFAGSTTSNGVYSGLIVGTNGQEIVGGISVDHVRDGVARIEVGAFIAEQ